MRVGVRPRLVSAVRLVAAFALQSHAKSEFHLSLAATHVLQRVLNKHAHAQNTNTHVVKETNKRASHTGAQGNKTKICARKQHQ